MATKFSPPKEDREQATEFARRRSFSPYVAVTYPGSGPRMQTVELTLRGTTIGTMVKHFSRGKHVSTTYFLPPFHGDPLAHLPKHRGEAVEHPAPIAGRILRDSDALQEKLGIELLRGEVITLDGEVYEVGQFAGSKVELWRQGERKARTGPEKHEAGKNPKIATGSGPWTVYHEVHRPLGQPDFHHHRFATKKLAESHARQLSLVESGRYITVHHRGLEVSEWYKGTTPREPGWAGGYRPHGRTMGPERAEKHESGRNPMIYTIRNANKKVVAKIVEGKPGEKIRVTSYDDLGRAYTHNEKSLFDAAAHVGGRGATVSGGWEDLEPSSRLLLQRWSAAKHESGRNPLTLGERAKMRLGVLSPAAARSANSREKDLFRSHTGEIQRLAESVEACRRCEHGAEKRALKQLALARKTLEGLTKLAKYRSDPDVAEASLKAFRRQIAAAEGVLTGKKPAAIVKRDPKAGRGRHSKFGEYEEAQVHESENNPRVSRTHPRRREVAVFKAHSSSRATAVAAKLRKAGHDSAVIGGYGGRTVVIDTPTRGTKGGSLSAADAALRAKIRVLVGKK